MVFIFNSSVYEAFPLSINIYVQKLSTANVLLGQSETSV